MEKTHESLSPFYREIQTTIDLNELREALDAFLSSLYKIERKSIPQLLEEAFSVRFAPLVGTYLKENNINTSHQEEVRLALLNLSSAIQSMRVLSLTLAIPATRSIMDATSSWMKKEFGLDTVIELTLNPELIGGAIIIFEGKYYDQSVKKKLDILFEVKKDEIQKILET